MTFKNGNGIKKLTAALAATAMFSAVVFTAGATTIGDLNKDGIVNVDDATYLQKILVDLETAPEDYETLAETYVDGKINVRDVTVIQMYAAKIIDTLPYDPAQKPSTEPSTTESQATEASSTVEPTEEPTQKPTEDTTVEPTEKPTEAPTTAPTTQYVPSTDENGWGDQIFKP